MKEIEGVKVKRIWEKSPRRVYIWVDPGDIREACESLFGKGMRFVTLSAIDRVEGIELLYHFSDDREGKVITLRSMAYKPECEVDSISLIIPGALMIEREVQDLFGVKFKGHPDPRRFIIGDDFPEGEYPLRRKE